jgi:hypothetical protein
LYYRQDLITTRLALQPELIVELLGRGIPLFHFGSTEDQLTPIREFDIAEIIKIFLTSNENPQCWV